MSNDDTLKHSPTNNSTLLSKTSLRINLRFVRVVKSFKLYIKKIKFSVFLLLKKRAFFLVFMGML